jgi:hypothetical protein
METVPSHDDVTFVPHVTLVQHTTRKLYDLVPCIV